MKLLLFFVLKLRAKAQNKTLHAICFFLPCAVGVALTFLPKDSIFWAYRPMSLQNAWILFPFALLGFLTRRYFPPTKKNFRVSVVLPLVVCTLGIGGFIGVALNKPINYYSFSYASPLLFYISATFTIFGLHLFCAVVGTCRPLEYVGRNSLAILVMHKFPALFFQVAVPGVKTSLKEGNVPISILAAILSTILCCVAAEIIYRTMPWLLGKQKRFAARNAATSPH